MSLVVEGRRAAGAGAVTPAAGRRRLGRVVIYALLVLAALFYLLPLYLVVITALKEAGEINLATTWRLPSQWNWSSFVTAWEAFAPKLYNSLVLGVCATLGSALLGSLNGYVLSKWSFRGANVVFPLMLFGMFIPSNRSSSRCSSSCATSGFTAASGGWCSRTSSTVCRSRP